MAESRCTTAVAVLGGFLVGVLVGKLLGARGCRCGCCYDDSCCCCAEHLEEEGTEEDEVADEAETVAE